MENRNEILMKFIASQSEKREGGEMIRRADGSYSERGLWDNIRANRGSGEKPTKEMLEQEEKIQAQEKEMGGCMECGGQMDEGGATGCPPGQHWDGKKCVPNDERTLMNTAAQFTPGYETYLDLQDIYNGVRIGDVEQLNRGIMGLGSPMSGKALTNSIDYVTEKTLGKQVADQNATKRNDILNMSNEDRQKLYMKYGPGGYDKWKADGFPKLAEGGEPLPGKYRDFKNSLPENLRNTPEREYAMRYYWKHQGKPENFEAAQAGDMPMFSMEDDGMYHSVSVEPNTLRFLKPKDHPTISKELEWYNSNDPEAVQFRSNYDLDTSGKYYRYVPKQKMAEGGQMMDDSATMDQNQQQGGIEAALNEVANMIMQGENPEAVVKEMMGEGVPQETAVQLVQEAMKRLQEDDQTEEEDVPMTTDEIDELVSPMQGDEPDGNEYKTGGSIKLDPAKKGTFKAQATRMGMSVQEAATYILKNKEEFSPAMVKKANFAKNFAKELGGEMPEFKNGGGIPARYKKQGFTRVGAKRKSTRPGKKWMVLAKKGDQYKIVHGGYKGMKDYTQHHNNKRRDRFWDRMGGRNSAKAQDPFSPLYWHKRFGTWAEGGPFMEGDTVIDQTTEHTLANLENNAWNRGLAKANTLGDPRSMVWALPDKGILGKVKAAAGLASGLSGAVLGYEKLFNNNDKSTSMLNNANTGEYGNTADILDKRDQAARRAAMLAQKLPTSNLSATSGSGLAGMEAQWKDKDVFGPGYLDAGFAFGGELPMAEEGGDFREWFIKNAQRPDVMANVSNQAKLMEMWRAETGQTTAPPAVTTGPVNTGKNDSPVAAPVTAPVNPQANELFNFTERGDSAGILAANNALAGFGMVNSVLGEEDRQKEYERMMRRTGNSDARYKSYNPTNPFGNYTLNAGPASNFGLVANTPVQDFGTRMSGAKYGGQFREGGEYYVSDKELKMILAMGGEIEFLD